MDTLTSFTIQAPNYQYLFLFFALEKYPLPGATHSQHPLAYRAIAGFHGYNIKKTTLFFKAVVLYQYQNVPPFF